MEDAVTTFPLCVNFTNIVQINHKNVIATFLVHFTVVIIKIICINGKHNVNMYCTTRKGDKDHDLNLHRCGNLESHMNYVIIWPPEVINSCLLREM
jgi:hypothetical protein